MTSTLSKPCFRPLWGSFLFLWKENEEVFNGCNEFPSPMGIFFVSMNLSQFNKIELIEFPSPMGIFFVSMKISIILEYDYESFRPLWGSFLFLYCPMETLPGIEKTCTLRCKKFSPAKSGDLKLFKCSVPRFYALRCKTTILLVLSSPSLDHKYDLTE